VDIYPALPALPPPGVTAPVRFIIGWDRIVSTLTVALGGALGGLWALAHSLPRLPMFQTMTSQASSGEGVIRRQEVEQQVLLGQMGVTLSPLRPGGKAQFGDRILDVISEGQMMAKGARVKILRFSARDAIVAELDADAER
jgi:membrane-bound serine protease (ClpP class)